MTPEERLEKEGLQLPVAHPVLANYASTVRSGNLVFVSGHGPFIEGNAAYTGKLGADVAIAEGRKAAEVVMLNILGTLRADLGELSRITRFVKLLVLVNATSDFSQHHLIADGATDLLVKVFADLGRPARSAVGIISLPFNISVEIEAIVEVAP